MTKKIITGFISVVCALALICFAMSIVLSNRVNAYVHNLADRMTQQIGYPVKIEKVTTNWDWLLLKVNIKNLSILDQNNDTSLFMVSEIVSTVDAIDSLKSFSLKFKQLLLRSPRLSVQWNGTTDLSGQLDPKVLFKLLAMQRHILVEDGDLHLQGLNGADLPFMDLRIDLRQTAEQEYIMTARGNIAAAIQPEFVLAIKYYGELVDYENALMDFEIKTSNLQLAELFNFIPKYHQDFVKGDFTDFDLKGVVQNGTVRSISSDFAIDQITINKDTLIRGGKGHISYKPGGNTCELQLGNLTLFNQKLFTHPLNIDAISAELVYNELSATNWSLNTNTTLIKFADMDLEPSFSMQVENNKVTNLELNSSLSNAKVQKLFVLLPDKLISTGLNDWLKHSLVDGALNKLQLKYANNAINWSANFNAVKIDFSPQWPAIDGVDAVLSMQNGILKVDAEKANILGHPIQNLNLTYKDVVLINGHMDTTLTAGLDYLLRTPLRDSLGNKLAAYSPEGKMGLDLQLRINTASTQPIEVKGAINLNQAKLRVPGMDIMLQDMHGKLKFTNDTLNSETLSFKCFGQAGTATVATSARKAQTLNIVLNTQVPITEVQKSLPNLSLDHLHGSTNVKIAIELPWGSANNSKFFNIQSDLHGISSDLPPPFNKETNTKLPMTIQYSINKPGEDTMRFKAGDLIDGILFIKDQQLHGGRVSINKKLDTFVESESLLIYAKINKIDWAQWSPLLSKKTSKELLPVELDIQTQALRLFDTEYGQTRIKYISAKNQLLFDNQIAAGSITISNEKDKIDVKLDKLNVPDGSMETTAKNDLIRKYLREQKANNQLPLVQFSCDKLVLKKHIFKKISLEMLPRTYGYEIMNFSIANDHLLIQGQGSWQMDNQALTSLTGNAYTQNFGKVLAEWGFVNSMTRGNGELNFAIQWQGDPLDFDLLHIEGNSHIDLRSGSLTNVNPGFGRIIGLLSLESIQRRLQLDFSDLLSKGFAFDKFVADLQFNPGHITTNNVLINSPSAKIEFMGKTEIKSQNLDCTMFVTPKVGASLPIAAAIAAGNPAVGAAIWLFDKASGSKISEITKYKYKVTGTWDKPQIDEVSNKSG
jgi:uncharacterized protein (TIGR02099 family)